jgi:hypothetical protein
VNQSDGLNSPVVEIDARQLNSGNYIILVETPFGKAKKKISVE